MDALTGKAAISWILIALIFISGCSCGCLEDSPYESPVTVSPTETPSVSARLSEEEAREIALSDPEIQEKIRGYTINVSVREGHLGPPDADVAYVVYIEVFDPCTGSHVITHLVSVNDEGEIVSKYYLTPPKIPSDLPKNTSSGAEPTVTVTPPQSP
jgi:hypothetical protein